MNLIKSKINSLAWLSSAISVSVVGGVVLSSTPVLAASISKILTDTEEELSLTVIQPEFKGGRVSLKPFEGRYWRAEFTIDETQGYPWTYDKLSITVLIQHLLTGFHPGENSKGKDLKLVFDLNSITQTGIPNPKKVPADPDWAFHSGTRGHVDNARGTVTAYLDNNATRTSDINRWNLEVKASHGVPEPLTMLGAATALGYGALLKRKHSENKKT